MEPQHWTIYALYKPFQDWKSIGAVDLPIDFIGDTYALGRFPVTGFPMALCWHVRHQRVG